jgi:hypothetical protein
VIRVFRVFRVQAVAVIWTRRRNCNGFDADHAECADHAERPARRKSAARQIENRFLG